MSRTRSYYVCALWRNSTLEKSHDLFIAARKQPRSGFTGCSLAYNNNWSSIMIDPEQFEPNQEIEGIVRSAFHIQDPDHSFIDRLQKQLTDQYDSRHRSGQVENTRPRPSQWLSQIKLLLSPLAWGAFAFILILSLIWEINTLIPRTEPGRSIPSSPTPQVSPTAEYLTLSTPSIESAIFYTVEAGDSLSIIEKKTGVPMKTLHNLNEFVLQLNELVPGLQLVKGFTDQTPG